MKQKKNKKPFYTFTLCNNFQYDEAKVTKVRTFDYEPNLKNDFTVCDKSKSFII